MNIGITQHSSEETENFKFMFCIWKDQSSTYVTKTTGSYKCFRGLKDMYLIGPFTSFRWLGTV